MPFMGKNWQASILAGFTALIMIYGYTRAKLAGCQRDGAGMGNTDSHCPEPVHYLPAALRSHLNSVCWWPSSAPWYWPKSRLK